MDKLSKRVSKLLPDMLTKHQSVATTGGSNDRFIMCICPESLLTSVQETLSNNGYSNRLYANTFNPIDPSLLKVVTTRMSSASEIMRSIMPTNNYDKDKDIVMYSPRDGSVSIDLSILSLS